MDDEEIAELLEEAEDAWPDNEFVESCQAQFASKGTLSEKQIAGLQNIVNARKK